jgi:hypothetical protein
VLNTVEFGSAYLRPPVRPRLHLDILTSPTAIELFCFVNSTVKDLCNFQVQPESLTLFTGGEGEGMTS